MNLLMIANKLQLKSFLLSEVTPGPKCKDWNEVLVWIEKFKTDSTLYTKERKAIKDKFHKYQDDNSCKRVYNELITLIGE